MRLYRGAYQKFLLNLYNEPFQGGVTVYLVIKLVRCGHQQHYSL